jgi:hypothetical protein
MLGRMLLAFMLMWSAAAVAAEPPSVSLAATDPGLGDRLGHHEPLYLRFTYRSESAIRIEVEGFAQGKKIPAMTGGAPLAPAGQGEAMTWIAFKSGTAIDELRIIVRADNWREISSFRIPAQLRWDAGARRSDSQRAEWVARLQRERDAREAQQQPAIPAGYDWLGFVVFGSVPLYFILQALLAIVWRRGWRIAALVPLAVMAPAFAFSLYALLHGSNLWPITLLLLSPLALIYLLVVGAARVVVATRA